MRVIKNVILYVRDIYYRDITIYIDIVYNTNFEKRRSCSTATYSTILSANNMIILSVYYYLCNFVALRCSKNLEWNR